MSGARRTDSLWGWPYVLALGFCLYWLYRYTELTLDIGPVPITAESAPDFLTLLMWAGRIGWVLAGVVLVDMVWAWRGRSTLRVQKAILGILTIQVLWVMNILLAVLRMQLSMWT